MKSEVTYSDPVDLEYLAPFLPYNYLPAAFSAIRADPSAKSRMVFLLPVAGESRIAPRFALIDVPTLSEPQRTADFIRSLLGNPDAPGDVKIFLGPEVEASSNTILNDINASEQEMDLASFDAAVVVIDAGIAFWNRRFRGPAGPRFREIRFLDFQRPDLGLGAANLLGPGQIGDLCDLADAEGSAQVMDTLGRDFPNSFYGKAGGADVDGIWHGTAVADLAAGAGPGTGPGTGPGAGPGGASEMDRVALFGIELPASLLRESDGDALTAVLMVLVDQVIQITQVLADKHVVVVLPFGFVGGPQDGMHPAAQAIDALLSKSPQRTGTLTFMVPAGNHLQDRCRARLPQAQAGVPVLSVDWHIAPDDFSTNQIEIVIDNVDPADERASLRIALPGPGATQAIGLKAGQHQYITVDGAIVGTLMRYPNVSMPPPTAELRARLRLCLAPTGYGPGGLVPAPHGRWRLSSHSVQPVDLWVLRDDRNLVIDAAFPRRSSWLDDPLYEDTDQNGAPELVDQGASLVLRSGTLSVLATAPAVEPVQADEQLGAGPLTKAFYSGSPDLTATALAARLAGAAVLVDDGRPVRGAMAAANGTERQVRFSGTSAAVAMSARARALAP